MRRELVVRSDCKDTQDYAFKISAKAALRDREDEARPVIMAELQQIVDKNVCHGVHSTDLSVAERKAVIRSSMFLKDTYMASGAFDKLKARLVAGGVNKTRSSMTTCPLLRLPLHPCWPSLQSQPARGDRLWSWTLGELS